MLTVNSNDSLLWFGSKERELQTLSEDAEAEIISLTKVTNTGQIKELETKSTCISYIFFTLMTTMCNI